jgi:hypothetical protein
MEEKRTILSLGWVPQSYIYNHMATTSVDETFYYFIPQLLTDFFSMISSTVRALNALFRPKIKRASINARSMGQLV